jgi:hypothetical protein
VSSKLRRGALALAVTAICAGFVPGAQARTVLDRPQPRGDAWAQIEPLLRERSRPKATDFDFEPTFKLKTASGFTVRVAAFGSSVGVLVGRGKHDVSGYLARGVATSRRLQASFGRFGRLEMRFHPSTVPSKPGARPGCRGRHRHPELPGTWEGTLRFKSDGGYVSVDVHRALGSIRRRGELCPSHRPRPATASSGPFSSFSLDDSVAAGWHQGLEGAQVMGFEARKGVLYLAFAQQAFGSVAILRVASVLAKPGTLSVNSALTHAEISPPAPFHGTGTYTAAPDGTTAWAGSLTVNFPGSPRFPLTGERFKAEVTRAL